MPYAFGFWFVLDDPGNCCIYNMYVSAISHIPLQCDRQMAPISHTIATLQILSWCPTKRGLQHMGHGPECSVHHAGILPPCHARPCLLQALIAQGILEQLRAPACGWVSAREPSRSLFASPSSSCTLNLSFFHADFGSLGLTRTHQRPLCGFSPLIFCQSRVESSICSPFSMCVLRRDLPL